MPSWGDIVRKADIVLSIIPPRDAVSFAERLLREHDAVDRLGKAPLVFADCNAVNVVTIQAIAALFATSTIKFIDGCIIGGPPSGTYVPTFYGSTDPGDEGALELFEGVVGSSGIRVRLLNGEDSAHWQRQRAEDVIRLSVHMALPMEKAMAVICFRAGDIQGGLTGLFTTIILGRFSLM